MEPFPSVNLNPEIIEDVKRVASELGQRALSRTEYLKKGKFTCYQLYDGGVTFEQYCLAADIATRKKEPVPDEVYFERLRKAHEALGRLPKSSERKKYGLNFSKRRYPTLSKFTTKAASLGYVSSLNPDLGDGIVQVETITEATPSEVLTPTTVATRAVPPIPAKTKRRKWERTGVEGFPYAPQDESGVVALFAILCAKQELGEHDWSILEFRHGKGIDATCYDHNHGSEIRVELKHRLSKAVWDKQMEDVDFVVCWENAYPGFPKPVVVLSDIVPSRPTTGTDGVSKSRANPSRLA